VKDTVAILFFASLADELNCRELNLDWSPELGTANALKDHLSGRGGNWERLGSDQVRCAVNREIVKMDHPIQPGDEVAFFPPVTGG
jgi:molybdopterin synthase sulfur carrier subunit